MVVKPGHISLQKFLKGCMPQILLGPFFNTLPDTFSDTSGSTLKTKNYEYVKKWRFMLTNANSIHVTDLVYGNKINERLKCSCSSISSYI